MPRAKQPPESHANGEDNGARRTTIDPFRKLAKRLVAVTPEELAEEERRYQEERRKAE
jgi:hypothetical protein